MNSTSPTPTATATPTPTATATGVTDDFNRADSTDLGANWTERAGDWQITSQTLRNASTGGDAVVTYTGTYADVEASAKVKFTSAAGTIAIGARLGSYSGGVLAAGYVAEISNTGLVKLWRLSDWAELGSYQIASYQSVTFTTLLISVDGSALRVDVDGTTRISTSDNTFTSGAVGLWSYGATAANQHVFDDFNLVDLSQGSAPSWNLTALFTVAKTMFRAPLGWFGSLFGKVRAALLPVQVEPRSLAVDMPAGQVWKNYILAGGQRVAMREYTSTNPTGTVYFLLGDHLGSTSVVVNASTGAVVSQIRYSAYGEERYTERTTPTNYRYTGQLSKMTEIGLYHYGARWFDPQLAHFTSPDTIVPDPGIPLFWNRYMYANYNPAVFVDQTGHFAAIHDSYGDSMPSPWSAEEHTMSVYVIALNTDFVGGDVPVPTVGGNNLSYNGNPVSVHSDFLYGRTRVGQQGTGEVNVGGESLLIHCDNCHKIDEVWWEAEGHKVDPYTGRYQNGSGYADQDQIHLGGNPVFKAGPGKPLEAYKTVAAPKDIPMGTLYWSPQLHGTDMNSSGFLKVIDQGGNINGVKLDLYVGKGFGASSAFRNWADPKGIGTIRWLLFRLKAPTAPQRCSGSGPC